MGFNNSLSAAQIASIFNAAGNLDGGNAGATYEDVDGGTATTHIWDIVYDGGSASG